MATNGTDLISLTDRDYTLKGIYGGSAGMRGSLITITLGLSHTVRTNRKWLLPPHGDGQWILKLDALLRKVGFKLVWDGYNGNTNLVPVYPILNLTTVSQRIQSHTDLTAAMQSIAARRNQFRAARTAGIERFNPEIVKTVLSDVLNWPEIRAMSFEGPLVNCVGQAMTPRIEGSVLVEFWPVHFAPHEGLSRRGAEWGTGLTSPIVYEVEVNGKVHCRGHETAHPHCFGGGITGLDYIGDLCFGNGAFNQTLLMSLKTLRDWHVGINPGSPAQSNFVEMSGRWWSRFAPLFWENNPEASFIEAPTYSMSNSTISLSSTAPLTREVLTQWVPEPVMCPTCRTFALPNNMHLTRCDHCGFTICADCKSFHNLVLSFWRRVSREGYEKSTDAMAAPFPCHAPYHGPMDDVVGSAPRCQNPATYIITPSAARRAEPHFSRMQALGVREYPSWLCESHWAELPGKQSLIVYPELFYGLAKEHYEIARPARPAVRFRTLRERIVSPAIEAAPDLSPPTWAEQSGYTTQELANYSCELRTYGDAVRAEDIGYERTLAYGNRHTTTCGEPAYAVMNTSAWAAAGPACAFICKTHYDAMPDVAPPLDEHEYEKMLWGSAASSRRRGYNCEITDVNGYCKHTASMRAMGNYIIPHSVYDAGSVVPVSAQSADYQRFRIIQVAASYRICLTHARQFLTAERITLKHSREAAAIVKAEANAEKEIRKVERFAANQAKVEAEIARRVAAGLAVHIQLPPELAALAPAGTHWEPRLTADGVNSFALVNDTAEGSSDGEQQLVEQQGLTAGHGTEQPTVVAEPTVRKVVTRVRKPTRKTGATVLAGRPEAWADGVVPVPESAVASVPAIN